MASSAPPASPSIWRRSEHEVSLVRLYVLRAVALFFVLDGLFSKLPDLIYPDPASRGIIASLLVALWVSAFFVLRYPLRMVPILLFEIIWKTLWLIDYGLPQWLAGTGSARLNRDMFEIGFFPFAIALIVPWGHVWRLYVRQPADRWRRPRTDASASSGAGQRGANEVSATRVELVRSAFLLAAIAGCFLVLPGLIRPDPAARGMLQSMIAGLWVCSFLGLRYPLQMLPILLFEFVATAVWLIDYGLPHGISGAATPQFQSDLLAIGGVPIVIALLVPWRHVWRRYIRASAERWR
jgi:hypothetical protein